MQAQGSSATLRAAGAAGMADEYRAGWLQLTGCTRAVLNIGCTARCSVLRGLEVFVSPARPGARRESRLMVTMPFAGNVKLLDAHLRLGDGGFDE